MIAYKGFDPGLICRGYKFVMGLNVTEKANCRENGFHCAENPLDCLAYYGDLNHSEYYIVEAGGDIDEDEEDSKISCTELTILRKLANEELFVLGLAFMVDHPKREWNQYVQKDRAEGRENGYAIVCGRDPVARGGCGAILAIAKENASTGTIEQIMVTKVDGKTVLPDTWYDVDLNQRTVR